MTHYVETFLCICMLWKFSMNVGAACCIFLQTNIIYSNQTCASWTRSNMHEHVFFVHVHWWTVSLWTCSYFYFLYEILRRNVFMHMHIMKIFGEGRRCMLHITSNEHHLFKLNVCIMNTFECAWTCFLCTCSLMNRFSMNMFINGPFIDEHVH